MFYDAIGPKEQQIFLNFQKGLLSQKMVRKDTALSLIEEEDQSQANNFHQIRNKDHLFAKMHNLNYQIQSLFATVQVPIFIKAVRRKSGQTEQSLIEGPSF